MISRITFSALALAIIFVASCQSETGQNQTETTTNANVDLSNGFNLLESNCFTCHSPKGAHDARIAPPMVAIKKHYIDDKTTLGAFSEELIAFVKNPSQENAKLKGAVEKFGVMPKMEFSEDDLRDIAAYIYEKELESPDWFEDHYQQEKKRHREQRRMGQINYLEEGKSIAMQTKAQLGKNLMAAVKERGAGGAVEFCNTRAIHLTDSMAIELSAKVKRVSDQPRNPNNQASQEELTYISSTKELLAQGLDPQPQLTDIGKTMVGYYPITTNQMCLKCHGQPTKQINPETLAVIDELYPEDKAKGYGENELRGIWVVEMEKKDHNPERRRKGKGKHSE